MANEDHLALLRQGIKVWNQWRKDNPEVRPNIRGVNFSKAILIDADLSGADLRGANLRESDLGKLPSGVYGIARVGPPQFNKFDNPFAEVSLSGVDLRGADLRDANLSEANLRGANLRGANLSETNLSEANLSEQVFADFYFSGAVFSKANLSQADLNGIDLSKAELSEANLNEANLSRTNLSGANLSGASFDKAIIIGANFSRADLREADLSRAFLCQSDFSKADLSGANLSEANLSLTKLNKATLAGANLIGANLAEAVLSEADLNEADLSLTRALGTDFSRAHFTGTCLGDWNYNSKTKLDSVICDYVYLQSDRQERQPSSGNFEPGEFAKLFQKALETVDLIFSNGVDWKAFAYSFKNTQVLNEDTPLDIKSIEKKGDGIILIRVSVPKDADKTKIHGDFLQGYEFAHSRLEPHYQARLDDKNQEINRLVNLVNHSQEKLGEVAKLMAENTKVNMVFNSSVGSAAGEVKGDQKTIQHNYAAEQKKTLSEAAAEIQQLLTQLQTKEYSPEEAQQQVATDLAKQAQSNPTVKDKLVRWGKYLGDAAANGIIGDVAVKVINLAIRLAGIPMA